ncbi:MAG: hypothetical protein C0609_07745, partial [Deltaproteobacteria bacterium]
AYTVFLGEADLSSEEILWKELLVFFMNTSSSSGYLDFLRSIEPLEFDPELTGDYLECFHSDAAKTYVMDELDHLYIDREDVKERLETMNLIGSPGVYFDSLKDEDEV